MTNNVIVRKWKNTGTKVDTLSGIAFTGESGAHVFRIQGIDADGQKQAITGTISGKFWNKSTGITTPLAGTIEDGEAVVALDAPCYVYEGLFWLMLFTTNGSTTTCIYCGVGTVTKSESEVIAYPSAATPDIVNLVNELQTILDNWPADYTSLQNDVSDLKSAISETTKNLWFNGDVNVPATPGYVQFLLKNPIPAGTYTVSCKCTSTYSGTYKISIRFSNSQDASAISTFLVNAEFYGNGTRQSTTITLTNTAYSVRVMSAPNVSLSSGETSTWENIQVESGSSATNYIPPLTADDRYSIRASNLYINSSNIGSTYADADLLPNNSIVGVAASAGMAHFPSSASCEIITFSHTYDGAVVQYAVPFNPTTDSKVYIRRLISGTWTDWLAIETNKNYVGYDLLPSGTTANRSQDIYDVLSVKSTCRLAPGDYYLDYLLVQDGKEIIGCGNATRIIKTSTSTYTYMLRLAKNAKLSNLCLAGGTSAITPTNAWNIYGSTNLGFAAVRIEGTGSDGQEFNVIVDDVTITGFAGPGIFVRNTGQAPSGGCVFDNIIVNNCNAGMAFSNNAEFHRISGCMFQNCYYGVVNNGGNNVFGNCDFSTNTQGILMDNSSGSYSNTSHGSFVGCTFNHSGNNVGTAIELDTMVSGEMFVGCNIFYGKIKLTGSQGIVFSGCNFGNDTPIEITNGGGIIFGNCVFRTGESPTTITGNTGTHFDNCYYLNGSAVNGTPQ